MDRDFKAAGGASAIPITIDDEVAVSNDKLVLEFLHNMNLPQMTLTIMGLRRRTVLSMATIFRML